MARKASRHQGANNLPTCIPLEAAAYLANSIKKLLRVAAESTKFRDRKWNKADVGATPHPLRVYSNLVFSARDRATSGDGGLQTPNKLKTTASIAI
jgi:hypothetical protein